MRERIAELDQKIRAGKIAEVRKELELASPKSVDREYWSELGNIARRVGLFMWALKLLRPAIHPESPGIEPSMREKVIYAANLIKIGSFSEAQALLNSALDSDKDAKLYLAFSHISQWEYGRAIPLLESYISQVDAPYEKCIGQVNLSAAYIQTGYLNKAERLLNDIRATTSKNNWRLLLSNCIDLTTQIYIERENWSRAQHFLHLLQPFVQGGASSYSLYYKKWQTLIRVSQESRKPEIVKEISSLRSLSQQVGHVETLRECDYYQAVLTKDQELFYKVYFGTPHPSYTGKLRRKFNPSLLPKEYLWQMRTGEGAKILCLFDGEFDQQKIFKCGSLSHKLLTLLSLDFYRPCMIGHLYSYLYPGEYFNPNSSPDRLAKVVQRARQELKAQGVPLKISVKDQNFSLEATAPFNMQILKQRKVQWQEEKDLQFRNRLDALRAAWPYQAFSSSQAAKALSLSTDSAQILLRQGLREQKVRTEGNGRSKKYFFKKSA